MTDHTIDSAATTGDHSLSLGRMISAGAKHSWRISASVALGVATATAVIVGALLVGDSMRGSLRALTIERLGKTEAIVAPGNFFAVEGITREGVQSTPLIYFPSGSLEARDSKGDVRRAGSIQIIGSDAGFWDLDTSGVRPATLPNHDGVVLNESAAAEIGVRVGDEVTIRLPVELAVPADSPLGRRDVSTQGLPRMKVLDIVPDRGLGRFAVSPSQVSPNNVFVELSLIADTLDRAGQANLLLFDSVIDQNDLNIDLPALGLSLRRVERSFTKGENANADLIFQYDTLSSDQLLLPEQVVDRVTAALSDREVVPTMTYVANAIERIDDSGKVAASVVYSVMTAIDQIGISGSSIGNRLDYALPDDMSSSDVVPLVINDWTARQLDASVGTRLRVAYYEPEVQSGKEIERHFDAIVTQVVPITEPSTPYRRRREAVFDSPPTIFNDPDLTPVVPGVTDQDSISDWDLPFPMERRITKADDQYWDDYRLTPKAFMPLSEGRLLFGSRFGDTTGLRISMVGESEASVRDKVLAALRPALGDLGWTVRPLRQQQLAASKGTTPFDGLFLALSFFVILSAVMLIAMLFRLGLVARMKQLGTLMALGWTPWRVAKVTLGEGIIVASLGVAIGVVGGILYALVVLWALRSWWVGAVTVPFLTFHWTTQSLLLGAAIGWLVAVITLAVTTRWILKFEAQDLLSGRNLDVASGRRSGRGRLPWLACALIVIAIGCAWMGARAGGQAAAGGFVGGGMMLLIAGLALIYDRLRVQRRVGDGVEGASYSLGRMVADNARRHPMRSTMTIGLMATAAFLIIAITAFRLQPTRSGTGGFTLVGETAQPLYRDLDDSTVRAELLGPDAGAMRDTSTIAMRMRVGQDASCNNLYQATQPTVLGVPEKLATLLSNESSTLAGFEFAKTDVVAESGSPWDLLRPAASGSEADPIPVIIDQNTAMWSLQMTGGIGEVRSFEYEAGKPIFVRVVGLLSNTLLQGRLLIGEANFEEVFPLISGYRYYLFDVPSESSARVSAVLENRLGDVGMDVSRSDDVLSGMLAVQNTYLRTFQSLGALGLLLGTIGLAVAQLRSVLERRVELAIMRAIGYTRGRLALVVMGETAFLLMAGIGCGALCAIIAVVPYSWITGARPPIVEPLLIVAGIIVAGMLAGLLAVRSVSRMPLLQSLRAD